MLCPRNVHRLYLAGVMLAAKLMDDNVFNNPYWAKVMAAHTIPEMTAKVSQPCRRGSRLDLS